MMHFVALLEAAQDGDGVFFVGLVHEHLLKTALEGGVLFDVLHVFVERGGADAMQLAPRQRRLEHVAGVHGAFGLAGADQGMQLIDEQDDRAFALGDFLEHAFQAFLEFAAEFGAGDQGTHVEGEYALAFQSFRHFAVDDALGQTFDDGGLAYAGFADQDRIVLGAALQYLDGAADFAVPADDGVEFAQARAFGEIDAIAAQGLAAFFGFGIGHGFAGAQVGDGVFQRLGADSARLEQFSGRSGIFHRRQQNGFAGDKAVALFGGDGFRPIQQFRKFGRDGKLAVVFLHARQVLRDAVEALAQLGDIESSLGEQRAYGTALLVDQGE